MTFHNPVSYINFFSRWVLFFAVFYKAYQTREKSWTLLTAAFFINALDVESYIFTPLGIEIAHDAYRIASKIPNFFMAMLLIWGGLHLKYSTSKFKHVVAISVILVLSYVWLFLLAANVFHDNFLIESTFPSFLYGMALIYFGMVLREKEISSRGIDSLFPVGLMLLGALNLTYPFTRYLHWFTPVGFLLGALFRIMAAVGAVKFVFIPFPPARIPAVGRKNIPPGAFLCPSREKVSEKFGAIEEIPSLLMVTRESLDSIVEAVHPNALVFWVTRVMEGQIHQSPEIYAISPTKIDILTDLIAKAVESGYRVVYIDAVEYLIVENGFENVLKFLLNVKDHVLVAGGTLILVVDPGTLDRTQRRILEREFPGE
ncbi:DUF835 domain-containing protein [Thermococcus sp. ES12]|nr:DUF835 domain-containing protein [Thermococcus sp. ES12]